MMRKAIQLSLVVVLLLQSCAWGAWTEFACRASGSNLNAGTRTGNSTEPGTAASFTYASGSWVNATGVFTVASGNPMTDGIVAGDFASVAPDVATVTPFVGRVTAANATTITVSLTAKAGTAPPDGTTNTTLRIGGAWKGPNAAENFPFGFVQNTLTNAAGDFPRVNFKNDASYSVSAAVAHNNAGPTTWQGYATAYGDGVSTPANKCTLDAGGGNFAILTFNSSATNNSLLDAIVTNNATGTVNGITISGAEAYIARVVTHAIRASGININAADCRAEECEVYNCNLANNASHGGFLIGVLGADLFRCIAHDNSTGSNCVGFRSSAGAAFSHCIADTNGGDGFLVNANTNSGFSGCDAYNNTGDGIDLANTTAALAHIENCNFIKNGAWGINGSGAGTRNGSIRNCAFGAGTQANTSGTVTGISAMVESGTVNYAADVTPWNAPTTGDFRITLAAAKGAGRGAFTQTQGSYTGTIGYPDIGSAQHLETASGGETSHVFIGN